MSEEKLSFEEAFQELDKTVQRLEEGELTLQESMALFERGMELVNYCGQLLDETELKVKALLPSPGEGYKLVEYSDEEGIS
ncbi:MAG: exodeoxyribonuclease VII small subunit [Anaerolineae bacterium]